MFIKYWKEFTRITVLSSNSKFDSILFYFVCFEFSTAPLPRLFFWEFPLFSASIMIWISREGVDWRRSGKCFTYTTLKGGWKTGNFHQIFSSIREIKENRTCVCERTREEGKAAGALCMYAWFIRGTSLPNVLPKIFQKKRMKHRSRVVQMRHISKLLSQNELSFINGVVFIFDYYSRVIINFKTYVLVKCINWSLRNRYFGKKMSRVKQQSIIWMKSCTRD